MDQPPSRMLTAEEIQRVFVRMSADARVTVWHISVFVALVCIWDKKKEENPIAITRKLIMRFSHIRSIATYHKCIRQLEEYGYLKYRPSYNYYMKTTVEIRT